MEKERYVLDFPDSFKVEMSLVSLKSHYEYEAMIQPPDVRGVYLERAKEIERFLEENGNLYKRGEEEKCLNPEPSIFTDGCFASYQQVKKSFNSNVSAKNRAVRASYKQVKSHLLFRGRVIGVIMEDIATTVLLSPLFAMSDTWGMKRK